MLYYNTSSTEWTAFTMCSVVCVCTVPMPFFIIVYSFSFLQNTSSGLKSFHIKWAWAYMRCMATQYNYFARFSSCDIRNGNTASSNRVEKKMGWESGQIIRKPIRKYFEGKHFFWLTNITRTQANDLHSKPI